MWAVHMIMGILAISWQPVPSRRVWVDYALMGASGMAQKLSIRDFLFSQGDFAIRGTAKGTLGLVNYPIVFGGQTVFPGDLIVGDDDGLVVVKQEDVQDVLEKTNQRIENEKVKEETLRSGVSSVTFNKFDQIFTAKGLIEE